MWSTYTPVRTPAHDNRGRSYGGRAARAGSTLWARFPSIDRGRLTVDPGGPAGHPRVGDDQQAGGSRGHFEDGVIGIDARPIPRR